MAASIDYSALPAFKSPTTSRLLPSIPRSQSWSLSQEANKKSGTFKSVCFATRQLHNKDGTMHRHGPRDNPCSGSNQLPLLNSVQTQQSISASQKVQPALNCIPEVSNQHAYTSVTTIHSDISVVYGRSCSECSLLCGVLDNVLRGTLHGVSSMVRYPLSLL